MSVKRYVVKLKFTSPLHIGEPGIGVENCIDFIHSDTLFSGIINTWAFVYGREDLEEIISDLPFRISSAFLYREHNGETVYYLPKPCLTPPPAIDDDTKEILKDMDFIPHEFFIEWISLLRISYNKDKLVSYSELYKDSVKTYFLPRNELDRTTLASTIYYVGLVNFQEDAGLYFLININEEIWPKFKKVLSLLGERGLGGERSIGCGTFKVKGEEEPFLKEPSSPHAYCTLSLTNPGDKEIDNIKEYVVGYHLIRRAGFVSSPFFNEVHKKRPCWMFAEGSVFNEDIEGQLVRVTPDKLKENGSPKYHPIYRYGYSFMIGVKRR